MYVLRADIHRKNVFDLQYKEPGTNQNQPSLYHLVLSNWSQCFLHYSLRHPSDVLTGCVLPASTWLRPHKKDVDPSTWQNRLAASH